MLDDRVRAMRIDLEPGQEWTDEVTITLTREQAQGVLMALSTVLSDVHEGIDDARRAASRGDLTAILVGPHLVKTAEVLHATLREITRYTLPALWAEVEKVTAANAADPDSPTH